MSKPDLSEFYRLSRPKKPPCKVGFVLDQITEPEREQLAAALATDGSIITAAAITEWLTARKHDVNGSAITSHRRRRCSCHA